MPSAAPKSEGEKRMKRRALLLSLTTTAFLALIFVLLVWSPLPAPPKATGYLLVELGQGAATTGREQPARAQKPRQQASSPTKAEQLPARPAQTANAKPVKPAKPVAPARPAPARPQQPPKPTKPAQTNQQRPPETPQEAKPPATPPQTPPASEPQAPQPSKPQAAPRASKPSLPQPSPQKPEIEPKPLEPAIKPAETAPPPQAVNAPQASKPELQEAKPAPMATRPPQAAQQPPVSPQALPSAQPSQPPSPQEPRPQAATPPGQATPQAFAPPQPAAPSLTPALPAPVPEPIPAPPLAGGEASPQPPSPAVSPQQGKEQGGEFGPGERPYKLRRLRPILVSVDNANAAFPQWGLEWAVQVHEVPMEGGVSRLLVRYEGGEKGKIGPVRSARPYILELARAMGAVTLHVGGSPAALAMIEKQGLTTFDGLYDPLFKRDASRRAPHNTYVMGPRVRKQLLRLRLENVRTISGKAYVPPKSAEPGESLEVRYAPDYSSGFHYDGKGYVWFRNGARTSERVSAVVVLKVAASVIDDVGRLRLQLTSGTGAVYLQGKRVPVKWRFEGALRLLDDSGKQLDLTPYKTWYLWAPPWARVR